MDCAPPVYVPVEPQTSCLNFYEWCARHVDQQPVSLPLDWCTSLHFNMHVVSICLPVATTRRCMYCMRRGHAFCLHTRHAVEYHCFAPASRAALRTTQAQRRGVGCSPCLKHTSPLWILIIRLAHGLCDLNIRLIELSNGGAIHASI